MIVQEVGDATHEHKDLCRSHWAIPRGNAGEAAGPIWEHKLGTETGWEQLCGKKPHFLEWHLFHVCLCTCGTASNSVINFPDVNIRPPCKTSGPSSASPSLSKQKRELTDDVFHQRASLPPQLQNPLLESSLEQSEVQANPFHLETAPFTRMYRYTFGRVFFSLLLGRSNIFLLFLVYNKIENTQTWYFKGSYPYS